VERIVMTVSIKLMNTKNVQIEESLQNITGLKEAYHFMRLRYANHIPIGIERHYYPVDLGEKLMQFDLNKASFYNLLEQELGIKAIDADQHIKAKDRKSTRLNSSHVSISYA